MSSASTTFGAGGTISPSAAQVNGWAQGTLGYAQVTASQGSITTEVDLTGLTVTVTLVAGRRIRLTGLVRAQSTVADDVFRLSIKEGSTLIQALDRIMRPANTDVTVDGSVVINPSAGSHTYKLTGQRIVGTGTQQVSAATGFIAFILCEDIGAV